MHRKSLVKVFSKHGIILSLWEELVTYFFDTVYSLIHVSTFFEE